MRHDAGMIRTTRHRIVGGDPIALADAFDEQHASCRAVFNKVVEEADRRGKVPSQFDLFKGLTRWRHAGVVGDAPVTVQRGATLQARTACAKHREHVEKTAWRLRKDWQQEMLAVEWLDQLPKGCDAPTGNKALKAWLDELPKARTPDKRVRDALLHKPLKRVPVVRDKRDRMRSRKEFESGEHRPALHFVDGVARVDAGRVRLRGVGQLSVKGRVPEDAKIAGAHLVERTSHPAGRGGRRCPQSKRRFELHIQQRTPTPELRPPDSAAPIGVDMGVVNTAATSGGDLLHYADESDAFDRIAESQRRNAGRAAGSVAHRKERRAQQREWCRIKSRQTNETRHLALSMALSTALLAIEDLRVGNMTRSARGTTSVPGVGVKAKEKLNRRLARSRLRALRQAVESACERTGATLGVVPPRNSSRTCAVCGHCDKGNRESQSTFHCLACGHQAHADVNAAVVILQRALAQLKRELETGGGDRRLARQLENCRRMASRAAGSHARAVETHVDDLVRLRMETGRFDHPGRQNREFAFSAKGAVKRLGSIPAAHAERVESSIYKSLKLL